MTQLQKLIELKGSVMDKSYDEKEIIKTKIEYSESFRLRVWSVLTEDMELLGKGYRAYYTHIFENFRVWETSETEFQNARGGKLNLDALKADDLYGFLGKKNQPPEGPKRKIEVSKMAVLDAFFQKKYASTARSFESGSHPIEQASVLTSFFSREDDTLPKGGIGTIVEALDGVFLQHLPFPDEEVAKMLDNVGTPAWGIPVFMINTSASNRFVVVHKAYLPLKEGYFKDHLWDDPDQSPTLRTRLSRIEADEFSDAQIWSGIGNVLPLEFDNPVVALDCMLRDRADQQPHLTSLKIFGLDTRENGGLFTAPDTALTVLSGNRHGHFGFCKDLDFFETVKPKTVYTEKFINHVFELKKALGLET